LGSSLYIDLFPLVFLVKKTVTDDFYLIQTSWDLKIPFIEYFIIPYLLWFFFIAVFVVFFFLKDANEFYKMTAFLITGMTIFLIISTVFPNGLTLRPTSFERDNIFVDICKGLWQADTATNVFPSIHVYNSIVIAVAVVKSKHFTKHKWIKPGSVILAILIILSTVFLKQHSLIDVVGGIALAIIIYPMIYMRKRKRERM